MRSPDRPVTIVSSKCSAVIPHAEGSDPRLDVPRRACHGHPVRCVQHEGDPALPAQGRRAHREAGDLHAREVPSSLDSDPAQNIDRRHPSALRQVGPNMFVETWATRSKGIEVCRGPTDRTAESAATKVELESWSLLCAASYKHTDTHDWELMTPCQWPIKESENQPTLSGMLKYKTQRARRAMTPATGGSPKQCPANQCLTSLASRDRSLPPPMLSDAGAMRNKGSVRTARFQRSC